VKVRTIFPAEKYLSTDELWVVTSYFNPAGYQTKLDNYQRFAQPILAAGIKMVTIECAFGSAPFELLPSPEVIQVRTDGVMWIKERLLNLAIAQLPPQAEKVAWVDCDILFADPAWAVNTAAALDRWQVVQPFTSVGRMQRGQMAYTGPERHGFAAQLQRRPESALLRASAHGQPGIAWAARRSLLQKHGLYDAAIMGGGDELFSHALGGGYNSRCVRGITGAHNKRMPKLVNRALNRLARIPWPKPLARWYVKRSVMTTPILRPDQPFFAHYLQWGMSLYYDVQGQVGSVPGMALHLWHGEMALRQYGSRDQVLKRNSFDPARDIRLTDQGTWEWATDKPQLHQDVIDYFFARQEDGPQDATSLTQLENIHKQ
jgi:hypothetical protein